MISRRCFNGGMTAAALFGLLPGIGSSATTLRVAAVQMRPRLADVDANLEQAEQLVTAAAKRGARWILLPEMFTTAAAFHPDLLSAIRPLDGTPSQMLKRLSRRHQVVIGGSFLASRDGEVYNSFLLTLPDGRQLRHDKDIPTYWERCFSREGRDPGVLSTPHADVGVALCWEMIRSTTLRRLQGRVQFLLGSSCWWTLSNDVEADNPLRDINLGILQQAPLNCARLLGVPVVHASHAGPFSGFFSPDLPDVAYDSHYLGESMVVNRKGEVLGRRSMAQGAGVVVADIELAQTPRPSQAIPDRFWIPEILPLPWQASWERWRVSGKRYYETVTLPYLQTGEIAEYVPEYML